MLTRLTVRHYKSLENVDLELGPLTVFVGRNGSGKSNIVDAIKFVRDAARNGLDWAVTERHGVEAVRQWSEGNTAEDIRISVNHKYQTIDISTHVSCELSIRRTEDGYAVSHEVGEAKTWDTAFKSQVDYYRNEVGEVFLREQDFFPEPDESHFMLRSDELFLTRATSDDEAFHPVSDVEVYTIFPNTLRDPQKISQSPHLSQHGDNLASILRRLSNNRDVSPITEIEGLVAKIMPRLHRITVESLGGYIVPRFLMREESGEEHYFDVNHLSDGTLRVLGILVALYQDPGPAVIALEEPELTVHPGALPLLADAMKEASKRRQVIVTTHSPDLLDQFDPDVIRVVEMDDRGVTTVSPLSPTQVNAVRDHLFTLGQLMSIEGLHS